MKHNILKSLIVFGAAMTLTVGCIEETMPEGSTVTASQVASSSSALQAMLNSVSAAMVTTGTSGYMSQYEEHFDFGIGAMHLMTENMLEDFVTLGDNPYYNRCYAYGMCQYMGPRYIYCAYFWDSYYPWIKTCNDVISSVLSAGAPTSDTAPILGKAYALRAYFYLDLARLFEFKPSKYFTAEKYANIIGLTVPIINENTKESDATNNPRAKREAMYDFILSDLANAETYLTGVSSTVYEPTIGLVNGLFARAYIEKGASGDDGAYDKAIEYADKVINGGYQVLTQDQWEDPTNGFNSATANNSWIWGVGITAENFNNICTYAAFISSEAQWGYAVYAQYGASKSFYESIPDNDFRKHSWLDPTFKAYYDYKFSGSEANANDFLSGTDQFAKARAYESIKFRPATGECLDNTVGNAMDQCMMRVEEMYFIKAEALAQKGSLSDAKTVLNDFMANRVTSGSYSSTASSKEEFLEELLFQKRVEFWGEGILIFDYKRLDHGITRGYSGTNWPTDWCFNCEGRSPQWNIVITRAETQSNNGIPEDLNNPDPSSFVPLWSE